MYYICKKSLGKNPINGKPPLFIKGKKYKLYDSVSTSPYLKTEGDFRVDFYAIKRYFISITELRNNKLTNILYKNE